MRISDWSSDVCSSDLYNTRAFWESEVRSPTVKQGKRNWPNGQCAVWCVTAMPSQGDLRSLGFRGGSGAGAASNRTLAPCGGGRGRTGGEDWAFSLPDRKSVV